MGTFSRILGDYGFCMGGNGGHQEDREAKRRPIHFPGSLVRSLQDLSLT